MQGQRVSFKLLHDGDELECMKNEVYEKFAEKVKKYEDEGQLYDWIQFIPWGSRKHQIIQVLKLKLAKELAATERQFAKEKNIHIQGTCYSKLDRLGFY